MQTPDRKHPNSRLALRRGIGRTRERELASEGLFGLGTGFDEGLPDPMGPPPTAASIVRNRDRDPDSKID